MDKGNQIGKMGSIGDDEPGEQMEINTVIPLHEKNMETYPNENSYMTKPGFKDEEPIDDDDQRETWSKKVDFLLSVIGFAVDLANVWRFPYLCYKNGGGAFLIPYVIMLLVGGIPLFYMELALGQFNRTGAITCWGRLCPLFKGIGWAVVLIAFYTDFFYNVLIAWCLHFFISSFSSPLPWVTCNNEWNTKYCYDGSKDGNISMNGTFFNVTDLDGAYNSTNETLRRSAAAEYFERGMLEIDQSSGLYDIGGLKWQLVLCLLGVYVICYFSLWKGIHTSGKVVWFTALFPYVVLFILMCRGATLDGAAKGIEYYLTPNFERLISSEVWVDAATQVYFSLGPGFGVLLAYASYNPLHNNVYRDALMTSAINCLTSFFSGFVIFMILGYMSEKSGLDIDKVATEGPGLVFIVYPEAIATLPGAPYWSIIFFLMLLTLGLDSSFGGSEAIITAIGDEFPVLRKHREIFVAVLFSVYFLFGLASVAQGGAYVVNLMERFAAGYSILFAVFFEALVVSWAYGAHKFAEDIEVMIGSKPGKYWMLCWMFVAPVFLITIMIFGLVNYIPLQYDTYVYPTSANLIGWAIALSSILCIPGFAIFSILRAKGTLMERLAFLLTPQNKREAKIRNNINTIKVSENNVGDHV